MIPDLDANGPILVWMSEHVFQVQLKEDQKEATSRLR